MKEPKIRYMPLNCTNRFIFEMTAIFFRYSKKTGRDQIFILGNCSGGDQLCPLKKSELR